MDRTRHLPLFFALFCLACYAYSFSHLSIFAGDTDLWYHLTGGRYLWQTGRIPDASFFSFVAPARTRVDYYWLFQALVYGVYSWAGYLGLVILRMALFTAFAGVVLLGCCGSEDGAGRTGSLILVGLGFAVTMVAAPRYLLLRPHTTSYLAAVLFLWILERKRRWVWALPVLAVLWVNLHGITYPVLYVICFSYLAEIFVGRLRRGTPLKGADLQRAVVLVLCLLAVFATPHGVRLLSVPFVSTGHASQYIEELKPTRWGALLSLNVSRLVPSTQTSLNLLLVAVGAAVLGAAAMRRVRLAPLLLVAGGCILLTKGQRMGVDLSILSLPMLSEGARLLGPVRIVRWRPAVRVGGAVLLSLLAFLFSRDIGGPGLRFPFSPQNLPVGVARFLKKANVGGRILNNHNTGGYLEWALYPDYKIFMDMEVPFFFTDEDMYLSVNAFHDPEVFRSLVKRYRPGFLAVPIGFKEFRGIVKKWKEYRPVFFDNAAVLYADAGQYPQLVKEHELKYLDPFELVGATWKDLTRGRDGEKAFKEIRRVVDDQPDNPLANQVLSLALLERKEYRGALKAADVVAAAFPSSPVGYKLRGDAWKGLGQFQRALVEYDRATDRSGIPYRWQVDRQRGLVYEELGENEAAYEALKRGVPIYEPGTSYKDLFYLASAAFLVGRLDEARELIRYAYEKVPREDTEWVERLDRYLHILKLNLPPKAP